MNDSEKDRAGSFDRVAESYHKARPSYPDQLVKDILGLAEMPESGRIIEIGCGTGQATALFARYPYQIISLEPGDRLAAIAEHNLKAFHNVEIVKSKFEDWCGEENAFDLMISAQAFHWLERDVAFAKAARLLKGSGALGLFWNRPDETGAPYREAFDDAYARYAPEMARPQADEALEGWINRQKKEIESSGLFGPVLVRLYPWSLSYDKDEYLELLGTYSDHQRLSEQKQRALYRAIGEEIERLGGSIVKKYLAVSFFAKRA